MDSSFRLKSQLVVLFQWDDVPLEASSQDHLLHVASHYILIGLALQLLPRRKYFAQGLLLVEHNLQVFKKQLYDRLSNDVRVEAFCLSFAHGLRRKQLHPAAAETVVLLTLAEPRVCSSHLHA